MRVKQLIFAMIIAACLFLAPACAGEKGVGVDNVVFNDNGTMTLSLTNGEDYTSPVLSGRPGADGVDGVDGVGIQDVAFNSDGSMTVSLTNGQVHTSAAPSGPQIVAAGYIGADGTIYQRYGFDSATWMTGPDRCSIPLTKVYDPRDFVTVISPADNLNSSYANGLASLAVSLYNAAGDNIRGNFSFIVLDVSVSQ